jgi:hypothetical protein
MGFTSPVPGLRPVSIAFKQRRRRSDPPLRPGVRNYPHPSTERCCTCAVGSSASTGRGLALTLCADNLVYTERRPANNIDPGSPVVGPPSRSSQASPNSPAWSADGPGKDRRAVGNGPVRGRGGRPAGGWRGASPPATGQLRAGEADVHVGAPRMAGAIPE